MCVDGGERGGGEREGNSDKTEQDKHMDTTTHNQRRHTDQETPKQQTRNIVKKSSERGVERDRRMEGEVKASPHVSTKGSSMFSMAI